MFEYFLIGSGFAFAAAVQPGPLQAFLFASVTQKGWKKTLPASFAPLLSDGPIALLMLLLLKNLPEIMKPILQSAGGLFLLFISYQTFLVWRKNEINNDSKSSAPSTIIEAAIVNILNPNPYIGWSLVLGPSLLNAWQKNPAYGVVLIASFYLTMIICLAGIIFIFGTSGKLNTHQKKILSMISIVILALLGMYQISSGIISLL